MQLSYQVQQKKTRSLRSSGNIFSFFEIHKFHLALWLCQCLETINQLRPPELRAKLLQCQRSLPETSQSNGKNHCLSTGSMMTPSSPPTSGATPPVASRLTLLRRRILSNTLLLMRFLAKLVWWGTVASTLVLIVWYSQQVRKKSLRTSPRYHAPNSPLSPSLTHSLSLTHTLSLSLSLSLSFSPLPSPPLMTI